MSETRVEKEKAERLKALNIWARDSLRLHGCPVDADFQLIPASDDASFRRYFRPKGVPGDIGERKFIFVDAPPAHENNEAFLGIDKMLASIGVHVPTIYRSDLKAGYMMLDDFGSQLLLDRLTQFEDNGRSRLVQQAVGLILTMQSADTGSQLPDYDEALLESEMCLFVDWFVAQQLSLKLDAEEKDEVNRVKKLLRESAMSQPKAFVHRDFHSRNLMVQEPGGLGVIDFQDAVVGPITYDLVSFLKDCYFRFPRNEVCERVENFRLLLLESGRIPQVDSPTFLKWFDFMGMQRHLKCAGIFSRLNLRDGKPRYLADIPLVIAYLAETCDLYPELATFALLLNRRIVPALEHSSFQAKLSESGKQGGPGNCEG